MHRYYLLLERKDDRVAFCTVIEEETLWRAFEDAYAIFGPCTPLKGLREDEIINIKEN